MPIRKTNKGYRLGKTGKTYPTRKQVLKQGRAIEANKRRKKK